MNEEKNSLQLALAGWITRGVVQAWPEETQHWARAFRAELPEIERPGASLRWAIGGIIMLTRAWWNHLLRSWNRPAGVPEAGPLADLARNASRVPRTPRFVTALLLIASLAFLMLPDVREGIKATFIAWTGEHRDWLGEPMPKQVRRLRQLGEQNHDPQALAIVALLGQDISERMKMADQAVALDASLTWIYAYVRTTDNLTSCCNGPVPAEWLDKLQKWDPDNAVPRLLVAHQSFLRFSEVWQKPGHRGPYDDEALKYLAQDKSWLAAMESVYRAPKYDHYYSRVFDLYRVVAERYSIRDMATTDAVLRTTMPVWTGPADARVYSQFLSARAEAAERAGNYAEAEELYRKPMEFSERMAAQTHTRREREAWLNIEGDSLRKLQALLAKTSRMDESALVGFKVDALQTDAIAWGPERDWWWDDGNGWEGFMIRFFAGAILLLGTLSLLTLCLLFWRRHVAAESRGLGMVVASLAIDFCPLMLLFASAGLFVAYRPVALMYDRYMNWPYPIYDYAALNHALFTPYESPAGIDRIFYDYLTPPNMWMALIVGLSMAAGFIALRGLLRKREATA